MKFSQVFLSTAIGALLFAGSALADDVSPLAKPGPSTIANPTRRMGSREYETARRAGNVPSWATPRAGDGKAIEARRAADARKVQEK